MTCKTIEKIITKRKNNRLLLAIAIGSALLVSLAPSAETMASAPQASAKAETPRTAQVADDPLGIYARIQNILHPAAEVDDMVDAFPVPKTVFAWDDSIIGTPLATQEQCVEYLLEANPEPDISVTPEELVSYYYREGCREGIRPDVAFAQAMKETGYFSYGGTVTSDQNNYCGLGTTSATVKGAYFATSELGVRAHIQHLMAYATTRQPQLPVVDPRYELVRDIYGEDTVDTWEGLDGRWAVPGYTYGESIMSMFQGILQK